MIAIRTDYFIHVLKKRTRKNILCKWQNCIKIECETIRQQLCIDLVTQTNKYIYVYTYIIYRRIYVYTYIIIDVYIYIDLVTQTIIYILFHQPLFRDFLPNMNYSLLYKELIFIPFFPSLFFLLSIAYNLIKLCHTWLPVPTVVARPYSCL